MENKTIKTKIWRDPFFFKLSFKEKVVFLFLITNEYIKLTGIYEMPDEMICFFCKISPSELKEMKRKFEEANKIFFKDNWVYLANFGKNNKFTPAPNIINAFIKEMKTIPAEIRKYFFSKKPYIIPFYPSKKIKIRQIDIDFFIDIDKDIDIDIDNTVPPTVPPTVEEVEEKVNITPEQVEGWYKKFKEKLKDEH